MMGNSSPWSSPSPLSNNKPKRRRATRSVTGCLTCRQRRVKCVVRAPDSTCDNCRRLHLVCNSSFNSNFKAWTPTGARHLHSDRESPEPPRESPSSRPPTHFASLADVGCSPFRPQISTLYDAPTPAGWSTPQAMDVFCYWSSPEDLYDDQFERRPRDGDQQLDTDDLRPSLTAGASLKPHETPISERATPESLHGGQNVTIDDSLASAAFSSDPVSDDLLFANSQLILNNGAEHMSPVDFSSPSFESLMWGLAPQMPLVYGNSHGDMPLLDGAEAWVPGLLTLKSSMWNPYKYMVNSTRGQPSSPLRYAVLGWTSSYLTFREQGPPGSDAVYCAAASQAVKTMLEELSASLTVVRCTTRYDAKIAEKLYLLLSTSFFLCSRDDMVCDYRSFHERLDQVKHFFEQNWHKLRSNLTALGSRLLLWLAYMDVRSSLFRRDRIPRQVSPISSSTGSGNGSSKRPRKDFMSFLVQMKALPELRNHPTGQSYLSECFGDSYPKKEIEEDLVQEPCHRICDDVVAILSSLREFEQWNDEYGGRARTDPLIGELRSAKIQALRANIARIKAESSVAFERPSYDSRQTINRTTFHALTVISLRLSATILLNRIVEPDARTDPVAHEAACELVRIAQLLRKAKSLERPRWLVWPLPLFVAGLEIQDEIYQEWLLTYMSELEHWGASMKIMRELLARIIKQQQVEGRRVSLREMADGFDACVIV